MEMATVDGGKYPGAQGLRDVFTSLFCVRYGYVEGAVEGATPVRRLGRRSTVDGRGASRGANKVSSAKSGGQGQSPIGSRPWHILFAYGIRVHIVQ